LPQLCEMEKKSNKESREAPTKLQAFWKILCYIGRILEFALVFALVAVALKLLLVEESKTCEKQATPRETAKYWLNYYSENDTRMLYEVENLLDIIGLERIYKNESDEETLHEDWDLLWAYGHHDLIDLDLSKLKYHQLINHLPNNHYITRKSFLTTQTQSKYIPKGFLNAKDLKDYATQHPEKRFVEKYKRNRGVSLKSIDEIRFDEEDDSPFDFDGYFAQEFLEDPFLYHRRKFDFSIYVAITSIDPLRVFYYDKYFLLRICPKDYDPSDFSDPDTYVISNTRHSFHEFNESAKYYDASYTNIDTMNAYWREHGVDVKKLWADIEDCIRSVFYANEKHFIDGVNYKHASIFNT